MGKQKIRRDRFIAQPWMITVDVPRKKKRQAKPKRG